jgi:hypothetical protein
VTDRRREPIRDAIRNGVDADRLPGLERTVDRVLAAVDELYLDHLTIVAALAIYGEEQANVAALVAKARRLNQAEVEIVDDDPPDTPRFASERDVEVGP